MWAPVTQLLAIVLSAPPYKGIIAFPSNVYVEREEWLKRGWKEEC